MPQTVRMIMYPTSRTADIILNVCKLGYYMTAGTSERFIFMVSDCQNIRNMTKELNELVDNKVHSCLKLVLGNQLFKFDITLWPEMLECLNDFFDIIDNEDTLLNLGDEDSDH